MTMPNWQAVGTGLDNAGNCAWPTHVAGDLGLLASQWSIGTISVSGWTEAPGSPVLTPESLSLFFKRATSASEADAAVSRASSPNHTWSVIATIRNAHQVYPFHAVAPGSRVGATLTTAMIPGLQTTIDDCLIVDILGWNADNAGPLGSGETNADIGTYTERYDAGTVTGDGGGLWIGSGDKAAPGAVQYSTLTLSTASSPVALKVAIAPIADLSIGGTVTIDGSPATEGEIVVYDMTQRAASYLVLNEDETTTIPVAGDGTWSALVPYSDHVYIAVYYKAGETEPVEPFISCASDAHTQAASTVYDIDHFSSGGGLVPPRVGSAFIR
jgi:hypothetical protein